MRIRLSPSPNPEKKLRALFTDDEGKETFTDFGQRGAPDYTTSRDKLRRAAFRTRHRRDLRTRDPTRAGFLSYHILWGDSTSREENLRSYRRRFSLS